MMAYDSKNLHIGENTGYLQNVRQLEKGTFEKNGSGANHSDEKVAHHRRQFY